MSVSPSQEPPWRSLRSLSSCTATPVSSASSVGGTQSPGSGRRSRWPAAATRPVAGRPVAPAGPLRVERDIALALEPAFGVPACLAVPPQHQPDPSPAGALRPGPDGSRAESRRRRGPRCPVRPPTQRPSPGPAPPPTLPPNPPPARHLPPGPAPPPTWSARLAAVGAIAAGAARPALTGSGSGIRGQSFQSRSSA